MTYPIMLLHGVCRFDAFWRHNLPVDNTDEPLLDLLHYFKGIRLHLKGQGFDVHHSSVPWAASVTDRARSLLLNVQSVIDRTGAAKVNLVAHSMGGLDARHMMFLDRRRGRIHERIASLTTISTPHAGSPFADWGVRNVPCLWPFANTLGVNLVGLRDLTTDACRRFNEDREVRSFEDRIARTVVLRTYAGVQELPGVFGLLKFSARLIQHAEGPNDGLVSVRSAKWRDEVFRGEIAKTDHLNELGWWDADQSVTGEGPQDVLARVHDLYSDLCRNLP